MDPSWWKLWKNLVRGGGTLPLLIRYGLFRHCKFNYGQKESLSVDILSRRTAVSTHTLYRQAGFIEDFTRFIEVLQEKMILHRQYHVISRLYVIHWALATVG
jgi:hypothetical protein